MAIETIFGVVDPALLGDGAETVLRLVGIGGAMLYLANYSMLQFKLLSGDSILFTALNMCAAALVLAGLTIDFDPSAAIIQIAWIVLGIIGIGITGARRGRMRRLLTQPALPGDG